MSEGTLLLLVIASEAWQSKKTTRYLDCFVVPPRNDTKQTNKLLFTTFLGHHVGCTKAEQNGNTAA